jgi:hypothetical protein
VVKESAATGGPRAIVNRAVREGLLSILFESSSVRATLDAHQQQERPSQSATSTFPETLNLDLSRIASLQTDVKDLTVLYIVLLLFKQITAPRVVGAEEMDTIKKEVLIIMRGARRKVSSFSSFERGEMYWSNGEGRATMDDVLLQLAARATKAASPSTSTLLPLPNPATLSLITALFNKNIDSSSPLFQLLQSRLKSTLNLAIGLESRSIKPSNTPRAVAVGGLVGGCSSKRGEWPLRALDMPKSDSVKSLRSSTSSVMGMGETAPCDVMGEVASLFTASMAKNGLSGLAGELSSIADGFRGLESFHLQIYGDWYVETLEAV